MGARARAIRRTEIELRGAARPEHQMGSAAALLASVPLLAAAVGAEADRTGLHGATSAAVSRHATDGPSFSNDSGMRIAPLGHPCLFGLRQCYLPSRFIKR